MSNRWIIVIFDKNVEKNIVHSLSLWNFFSMIRIWSVDFKAKWSVMTMKKSSSKYCDNFVKTQISVVVSNFVAQYFDSTSIKTFKKKKNKTFYVVFFNLMKNDFKISFFIFIDIQNEKSWKIRKNFNDRITKLFL